MLCLSQEMKISDMRQPFFVDGDYSSVANHASSASPDIFIGNISKLASIWKQMSAFMGFNAMIQHLLSGLRLRKDQIILRNVK